MYGRLAELVLILVLFLLFFGTGKLPKVMGEIGRGIRMLREGLGTNGEKETECDNTPHTTSSPRGIAQSVPPALPQRKKGRTKKMQISAPDKK